MRQPGVGQHPYDALHQRAGGMDLQVAIQGEAAVNVDRHASGVDDPADRLKVGIGEDQRIFGARRSR